MKLSTLKNETPDGRLVVLSHDLSVYADAGHIAPNLQMALDNWHRLASELEQLYADLNEQKVKGETFNPVDAASPLPRSFQWLDGSAYINHVELVRQARGAEMPESFWHDPLMYQGGSDRFLDPRDPITFPGVAVPDWGIDFEGEVAVITDHVPMGISATEATDKILLVMIANDVSLRGLIPDELAKGFGFVQSKPASAFSPAAVTPDALGKAWRDGKLHLPLLVEYNGKSFGKANAGIDMTFGFGQLIEHAAKSRNLAAGTIIGSGTVSNKMEGGPGKPIETGGVGYSCIAELRMIETIETGKATTPFMGFGDTVKIDMRDEDGMSIFGSIEQTVEKKEG